MAKLKNGQLSGKIGTMVAYKGKSGSYVRKAPQRSSAPTEAETRNRFIFGMVQRWLHPISGFLRLGFRGYRENLDGKNAAVSVLYKTALQRNGYESAVNPALLQVSSGKVSLPQLMRVALNADRMLEFSWDTEVDREGHPRDRVMLLAYNPEAGEANYELYGPERRRGSGRLELSRMPLGTYHVYAAFMGYDGKGQSGSRYLGEVEL